MRILLAGFYVALGIVCAGFYFVTASSFPIRSSQEGVFFSIVIFGFLAGFCWRETKY